MASQQRRYAKQSSSSNRRFGMTASRALQLSATIVPLGSAVTMSLSIGHHAPLVVYSALSLLSFCLYGFDKYRATNSGWRLRENMLHVVDLVGGWPGGYVAQQFFHHKTRKRSFQAIFWLTVVLHNLLWIWLYVG